MSVQILKTIIPHFGKEAGGTLLAVLYYAAATSVA